jgi:hypothetical protein
MALVPKEPEKEAGQKARQSYLTLARIVMGEPQMDYTTLYQRYAELDWAAIKLDDAVAVAALQKGYSPKATAGILYQSPYMQHKVHQQNAPLSAMRQYVKGTVIKAVQEVEKQRNWQAKFQGKSPAQDVELE